ncbi:MAG: peptidyl-prolyl cis-trans isomerase, partial [bacterium]|nr:peptidyl-prolyl cis-trans isomerase [bacterium]
VAEELLARYTGDTRNIEFLIVNAQCAAAIEEPTEADLVAYLAENQAQYRTEEQRTADVVVLSLETLAEVQEISEADIAAEYERTRDSRVRIERRSIVQAPLNSDQEAAFQAGLAEGRSFDELVAETGVEIVDLGTLAQTQVTDPALAEAAFGLSADGFTIIPGIGGQRVVAVTSIEPGGEITLAEARDEIEQSLRRDAARDIYVDVLDQVEELRAAFQPLAQIGERYDLPVEEVTMTASGEALDSVESIAPDARQRVASTVFAAEEDRLTPTITLSANTNIFVELKSVEPARDQTLDEVRDEVRATLVEERTNAAIAETVESIMQRLRNGEDFADVALSMSLFPSLSPAISRSGDEVGIIDRTVAEAAFNGGEGHFGSAVNALGEHVVFQVAEVIPAPDDASSAVTTYLRQTQEQALYSSFVSGLRDQAGVRIN